MSMERQIREEIIQELERLADDGQVWVADWITLAICNRHADGLAENEDALWWQHCGHRYLRDLVRRCINEEVEPKVRTSPQLVMDGFEHLQRAYMVERDGQMVGVPTQQLTDAELLAKAAEKRMMGQALFDHADEIDKYRQQRGAQAAG